LWSKENQRQHKMSRGKWYSAVKRKQNTPSMSKPKEGLVYPRQQQRAHKVIGHDIGSLPLCRLWESAVLEIDMTNF
jgi:hypothetical protein